MNKKTVLIAGGILTLVFFPLGIIVLIIGVLMKPSEEEIQKQEEEKLREKQQREQIREDFSKNPLVQSIIDVVVSDFSEGGKVYRDMQFNDNIRSVSVDVLTDMSRYRYDWIGNQTRRSMDVTIDGTSHNYSWEGEPPQKDIIISFRGLGIQNLTTEKAGVLQWMIYDSLKERCPYLLYRGTSISYRANISL